VREDRLAGALAALGCLVLAGAVFVGLVPKHGARNAADLPPRLVHAGSTAGRVAAAASPVVPIDLAATMRTRAGAEAAPVARVAPSAGAQFAQRYVTSADHRALLDEWKASRDPTANYFAAMILRHCLGVTKHGFEKSVKLNTARIEPGTPLADVRVDAYRQLLAPCTGLEGRPTTYAEIEGILAEGARSGDPRAIAQTLVSADPSTIADPQRVGAMLLDSHDPYVYRHLGGVLGRRIGAMPVFDGEAVGENDRFALAVAWDLVACDYGLPCGPDSDRLLVACAFEGACDLTSMEDYFKRIVGDPAVFRRSLGLRQSILDALRERNYAALGLTQPERAP
jgi:hypothetical protein